MFEYVANLHVHSTYSDGAKTVEEIAADARRAGIDMVGITDHRTLGALLDGKEGWYGPVLVLVGMESNDRCHHYLSFGVQRPVPDNDLEPQKVIDAVKAQGGIGFIAHPFEEGSRLVDGGKTYPWEDWSVKGFDGICIWNYTSQWRDGVSSVPGAFYQVYASRQSPMKGACCRALAQWDKECQQRKVVAIGGSDAHAVTIHYGMFHPVIFPYRFLFRCVNTHVLLEKPLTGDLPEDKRLVYTALAEGRCFVAFDFYHSSKGFRFWAHNGRERAEMGGDVSLKEGVNLEVRLPGYALTRVIRNGTLIYEDRGRRISYRTHRAGVYRVEVWKRFRPWKTMGWIYSNPIYIRE
ncbi:hypothetical protein SY88_03720 [Clostridiales bacterium PH28_bin88]|nr:hypothetical protein SY88_03720 [Clostridiales bacterium PH28_bin88]